MLTRTAGKKEIKFLIPDDLDGMMVVLKMQLSTDD
jgi:hypothetical protein